MKQGTKKRLDELERTGDETTIVVCWRGDGGEWCDGVFYPDGTPLPEADMHITIHNGYGRMGNENETDNETQN